MKLTVKNFLLLGIAAILVAAAVGYFMYNKPHADLAAAQPDFQLTTAELYSAFESDEAAANTQYLNKLIETKGIVKDKQTLPDGSIVLLLDADGMMGGISCSFLPDQAEALAPVSSGQPVKVRGLCAGFLMDVNLSRCIVVI
ncbi:MAG: hypothetical protein OHK0039_23220 [Bacteroidia bacterium]